MVEERLQVSKRIHSGLGGRLDHAHQEAAHIGPMGVLKKIAIFANQNHILQHALNDVIVQRCTCNGDIVLLLVKILKTLAGSYSDLATAGLFGFYRRPSLQHQ